MAGFNPNAISTEKKKKILAGLKKKFPKKSKSEIFNMMLKSMQRKQQK